MKRQTMYFMTTLVIVGMLSLVFFGLTGGVWAGVNAPQSVAATQVMVGTGFTYQGELQQSGSPANGQFDFRFRLFNAASGGSQVGNTVTKNDVQVTNGRFTVVLDFGSGAFDGNARWLEIAVRPGSSTGAYTVLSPRQRINPVPYALALPGMWTQQNSTSPNVIGGYSGNKVAAGVVGATIGGGGAQDYVNEVGDEFGTIGGGSGNFAGKNATIAGGGSNSASAPYATVAGGLQNSAAGLYSTVGGGADNVIRVAGESATIGGGEENLVKAPLSTIPGGRGAETISLGQFAYASGGFKSGEGVSPDGSDAPQQVGSAQFSLYVLRVETPGTDDTLYELSLYDIGGGYYIEVPISTTITFEALVTARDTYGLSAGWKIQGVVENTGGTLQLVEPPIITPISNLHNWQVNVQVTNTPYGSYFTIVGGGVGEGPIRWVAVVKAAQVRW